MNVNGFDCNFKRLNSVLCAHCAPFVILFLYNFYGKFVQHIDHSHGHNFQIVTFTLELVSPHTRMINSRLSIFNRTIELVLFKSCNHKVLNWLVYLLLLFLKTLSNRSKSDLNLGYSAGCIRLYKTCNIHSRWPEFNRFRWNF